MVEFVLLHVLTTSFVEFCVRFHGQQFCSSQGENREKRGKRVIFYIVIMFIINIVVIWGLAIAGAVHFRTLRLSLASLAVAGHVGRLFGG